MTHRTAHAQERGMLLIPVAFFVLILGGLSLGFLLRTQGAQTSLVNEETSARALEISEMALQRAEMEIRGEVDHDGDGLGSVSGTYGGGSYTVVAVQDPASPNLYMLTATAVHGHSRRRIEVGIKVVSNSPFVMPIMAKDDLIFTAGGYTDSYDTRLGTYASQAVNADAYGSYADGGADIGSNATIDVQGGAVIRGDATPGVGSSVALGGGSVVVGDTTPRTEPMELPIPKLAEFEAALATNNNAELEAQSDGVTISYDDATKTLDVKQGAEILLTGGTYFLREAIFSSSATMRVTGAVRIYLTDMFDMSGGSIANATGDPANLLIIAYPYNLPVDIKAMTATITLRGGAASSFALYAPAHDVNVNGGGDVYGSLVGGALRFAGGSGMHYDRALAEADIWNGGARTQRFYWVDRLVPKP